VVFGDIGAGNVAKDETVLGFLPFLAEILAL
jgi:hypothetical protein